jgi:hypothetical protein
LSEPAVAVITVPSVAVQVVTTGVIVPGSPSPSSVHALVVTCSYVSKPDLEIRKADIVSK